MRNPFSQIQLMMVYIFIHQIEGAVLVVIVWWLDLKLPMQSMPITTKVVSSNPAHGEVYTIQHYVIKFVNLSGDRSVLHDCTDSCKSNYHTITTTTVPLPHRKSSIIILLYLILSFYNLIFLCRDKKVNIVSNLYMHSSRSG